MMTGFKSKKAMANDKIAELIKEATATAWIDRIANGPVPMYAEEHMVKLAELIVQECAGVCDLLLDHKISSEWSRGTHDCSRAIKQHFGVEE
jgi:hypothetical protein